MTSVNLFFIRLMKSWFGSASTVPQKRFKDTLKFIFEFHVYDKIIIFLNR